MNSPEKGSMLRGPLLPLALKASLIGLAQASGHIAGRQIREGPSGDPSVQTESIDPEFRRQAAYPCWELNLGSQERDGRLILCFLPITSLPSCSLRSFPPTPNQGAESFQGLSLQRNGLSCCKSTNTVLKKPVYPESQPRHYQQSRNNHLP